ncbi:COX15/CtaA family protein [Fulvivirga sedimenti]|uniref:COX15/CtaA family protein n=1 Tax=Fulvivirga sedimenti TaxID=2879465 RepID=A0A9X1HMB2_9BACT|nr:COX15/CtaA family protein [Fulvivirga sedimenti]MCA6073630.1 COX15/CtaA family protein [Fulvivirga sedimenti]
MTNNEGRASRRYGTFSLFTLVSVYLLILVGGIVRTTGSGMGCPDWPKCFDKWVPPTSESELPANYREIYSDYRHEKNIRFAKYLRSFGLDETADQLLSDEKIREERPFNAVNTWVEYINRLLGALIGVFILLTVIFAIRFIKSDPKIFYTALATLILVLFQGWIGSIVVSTNLVPWMVTIHMLLAIVIVGMLVYLVYRSRKSFTEPYRIKEGLRSPLMFFLVVAMVIMVVQIVLGTQVREEIDVIAESLGASARESWIGMLDMIFVVHRSFSWIILFLNGYLFYLLWKQGIRLGLIGSICLMVFGSFVSGVIMAYAGMPAAAQPVHLLLGTGIIGLQFLLFLHLRGSEPIKEDLI